MKNVKFSIIIPCYNASSYIRACIESVLAQSYQDYEIIVVDDCSSDNGATMKILRSFSNIKILQTIKNSGAGMARNLGISNANGEYIIFIDSDDALHGNDTLERLNETIGKDIPDIVYTGFQFVGENFCFIPNDENCNKEFRLGKNQFINVWSIVWNTNFINNNQIQFPEYRFYEDVPFAFFGIALANTSKQANYVTYDYTRNRVGSSSEKKANSSKHFRQSRDTVSCIETLYSFRDLIKPEYLPYLLQRIEEQKELLLRRIDRGLGDFI